MLCTIIGGIAGGVLGYKATLEFLRVGKKEDETQILILVGTGIGGAFGGFSGFCIGAALLVSGIHPYSVIWPDSLELIG